MNVYHRTLSQCFAAATIVTTLVPCASAQVMTDPRWKPPTAEQCDSSLRNFSNGRRDPAALHLPIQACGERGMKALSRAMLQHFAVSDTLYWMDVRQSASRMRSEELFASTLALLGNRHAPTFARLVALDIANEAIHTNLHLSLHQWNNVATYDGPLWCVGPVLSDNPPKNVVDSIRGVPASRYHIPRCIPGTRGTPIRMAWDPAPAPRLMS